tara:strand:- start:22 stop:603 length:582 start_codon:yes stop_codon:yes gene_type:complete
MAKTLFESFYSTVHHRVRVIKDKSFKDVVGKEYEIMRKAFYQHLGLKASKEKIGNYNADLVVRDPTTDRILIIEEDKGHYVDSCFVKRFLMNAAETIEKYIQEGETVPYFILSSPTSMSNYEKTYSYSSRLFRSEIKKIMDEKIVYLPYCSHDRVSKKKYYKNTNNCFALEDALITKQLEFITKIKQGGNNVV